MPETISLIIVAEIRLLRDGLAEFLNTRDGIRVVGAATHHEEALPLLQDTGDAIVLIDVAQPSAVETVRAIVQGAPGCKVIALAVPELEPEVVRWAEEGTAGYVPRDAGLPELEACVRSVARGEAPYTPRMTGALLRRLGAISS
jgi:two-component system nitrate/nitrite response regulator NarL